MIDLKKILEEIKVVPEYDRQIMLQSVKDSTDPHYGIGRLKDLNHGEKEFTHPLFDMPYINNLLKDLKMYRTRLMKMPPYSCYSYHQDPTPRIHIPVVTHENCFMVIDDVIHRYPVGNWYLVDTTKKHTFINASTDCMRIHIVGCIDEGS